MTWRGWQVLMVSVVTSLVTALACVLYTNATARRSEQQWCGIVATLDDAYRSAPPQTPTGRKLAVDIHRLRSQFHCPRA